MSVCVTINFTEYKGVNLIIIRGTQVRLEGGVEGRNAVNAMLIHKILNKNKGKIVHLG